MENKQNASNNTMAEYLLKIQLIISNTEFKDMEEAYKYETEEYKIEGGKYTRAMLNKDSFNSYVYYDYQIEDALITLGYDIDNLNQYVSYPMTLPSVVKKYLYEEAKAMFIANYVEKNPYYARLTGKPFQGNDEIEPDEIIYIPDEFYELYEDVGGLMKGSPVHELSEKYQELFMNSKYYKLTLEKYPNATYLKYIGSNAIPIEVSRPAKDGEILRINESKLSTYHELFGQVSVDPVIVNKYVNIYNKTREYIYFTLRGNFADIYVNYNAFIRYLTIYMSIGNVLNVYMKESAFLLSTNNSVINNFYSLYGFPSVIMNNNSAGEFLKKFRQLLMDKGTNSVYRVKDLIGYNDTDIYTLIMVKQQAFADGKPLYYKDSDGNLQPKQEIIFRRYGTAEDNTSYFEFRDSNVTYTLEEISSGDPRWWNSSDVDEILENMNYTLSNSKYIQLSTNMSYTDIWWECVILLRGLLDNANETKNVSLIIDYNLGAIHEISLYDVILMLIVITGWKYNLSNDLYIADNFDYDVASFNYDIRTTDTAYYQNIPNLDYIDGQTLYDKLENIINRNTTNLGRSLMTEVREVYNYIRDKLLSATCIHEHRIVTELYDKLFTVNPKCKWVSSSSTFNVEDEIVTYYDIKHAELESIKTLFEKDTTDFKVTYNDTEYNISLYNIMNNDVRTLKINNEYIFLDETFVTKFEVALHATSLPQIQSLQSSLQSKCKDIINFKVESEVNHINETPSTFDALLLQSNTQLYKQIHSLKGDNESIVMLLLAIIKALNSYCDATLNGLAVATLGSEEYLNILKEVITYFKSYMVEFTKNEFIYLFGGPLDNGGNSDMLRLYDEIVAMEVTYLPKDSLHLYDVSYGTKYVKLADDNSGFIHDSALFRIKAKYSYLKNAGYTIWYDDGEFITDTPFEVIDDTTMIIADMFYDTSDSTYKLIINKNNLDVIPPNYYGNIAPRN